MAGDARAEAIDAMTTALETMVPWDRFDVMVVKLQMETALDAIPTDVLARYVVERRLLEHAERLANDPEIWASVAEIERRLAAGEPLDGITADEFRRQYLTEETPDAG